MNGIKEINYLNFAVGNAEFTVFFGTDGVVDREKLLSIRHLHALSELHTMLDGEVTIETEYGEVKIGENEVCIVPPLTYHSTVESSGDEVGRFGILFLMKKLPQKDFEFDVYEGSKRFFKTNSAPLVFEAHKEIIGEIKKIIDNYGESFSVIPFIQRIRMKFLLSLLFTNFIEQLLIQNDDVCEKEKTYTYDEEYYKRLIHLESCISNITSDKKVFSEFEDEVYLCERQISNIIKKEYGITAKYWTYEMKMKTAAQFMRRNPQMPICEIAQKVGYNSSDALSIMFKKYYGISATEYKRLN